MKFTTYDADRVLSVATNGVCMPVEFDELRPMFVASPWLLALLIKAREQLTYFEPEKFDNYEHETNWRAGLDEMDRAIALATAKDTSPKADQASFIPWSDADLKRIENELAKHLSKS